LSDQDSEDLGLALDRFLTLFHGRASGAA